MQFLKFIHILIGVTMLGFVIGYYFYFNFAGTNPQTRQRMLRLSLFIDCFIFIFILLLFMTGTHLTINHHLSFSLPWVQMAFTLMGLITFCWLILVAVKFVNYRLLRKGEAAFSLKRIFHTCNILMIVLMILIIHD